MKKILVLVMVLMLVGCDTTTNSYDIYDKLLEFQNNLKDYEQSQGYRLDSVLDRLDTIDMNIEEIEAEREILSVKDNNDCILKMLDYLLEGLDRFDYWEYVDSEQGIYYKRNEESEIEFISNYEILEESYCN